jgi:hypothetical protein
MNFSVPVDASMDEIEAMVNHGFEAMFEVYDAGGDPNVAFVKGQEQNNDDNSTDNNKNDAWENENDAGANKNEPDGETWVLKPDNPCHVKCTRNSL